MNFSKLRHRIIFLRPTDMISNSMGEAVPRYKPYKPYLPLPLQMEDDCVYLAIDDDGNAILLDKNNELIAHHMAIKEYSVAAYVMPMSGREYEESQKLRAETTYKKSTRNFSGISQENRILYNNRELDIISVLDLGERHEELQIIAAERSIKTAQSFDSGDYDG